MSLLRLRVGYMEQFTLFKTLSKADKIPRFCSYSPLVCNFKASSLTLLAKFSVREAKEASALLLVPAAVVGEGVVVPRGDGLLGATGLVQVIAMPASAAAEEPAGPAAAAVPTVVPTGEHVHDGLDEGVDAPADVAEKVPEELGLGGGGHQQEAQEDGVGGEGPHLELDEFSSSALLHFAKTTEATLAFAKQNQIFFSGPLRLS